LWSLKCGPHSKGSDCDCFDLGAQDTALVM